MAKKRRSQKKGSQIPPEKLPQQESFKVLPTSGQETRRFDKEMTKDYNGFHLKENQWTHARNAINNSKSGDLGKIGNEPANKNCINAPYTIIGFTHLLDDKWAIFSTDNVNSEVGFFEEDRCRYTTIVNSPCLNFNQDNLITGVARENFECKHIIYWADGLNPDRYLNLGNLDSAPYEQPWPDVAYICEDANADPDCIDCQPVLPLLLNCQKIRLEPASIPICLKVSKSAAGGNLLNGSYYAVAAYAVDGIAVTDYFTPSNIQPIFDHLGVGGSIDIEVEAISDAIYDEFELVVISVVDQQAVATKMGTYSTRQSNVTIDIIDPALPTVPIEKIPIQNVVYEKSDAMYKVNDYLIRVGPSSRFQFNYQPLANQIVAQWRAVEYPETYYKNGGNNVGYMRDEVYPFFIRWVYDDGQKSASFHIPGRPARATTPVSINGYGRPELETDVADLSNDDTIEPDLGINAPKVWQVWNTAYETVTPNISLCDKGILVSAGHMGYWESTERYPDDEQEIWNASAHDWSSLNPPVPNPTLPLPYTDTDINDYDLCGKPIRHHRFPDNAISPKANHFRAKSDDAAGSSTKNIGHIRIMGVAFQNIRPPVDNDGVLIPGIKGYEILRGSRKGNKTVIAKGIINNMVKFPTEGIPGFTSNTNGLFQNYPYNDLRENPFLSNSKTRWGGLDGSIRNYNKYQPSQYLKSTFSFHSPETNFANPFLSPRELKIYEDLHGIADMRHKYPDDHPKHIFLTDWAFIFSVILGLGLGFLATQGKRKKIRKDAMLNASTSAIGGFAGPAGVGTTISPAPGAVNAAQGIAFTAYATQEALKTFYYNTGLGFMADLIATNHNLKNETGGAYTGVIAPQAVGSNVAAVTNPLGHLRPYTTEEELDGGDETPQAFKVIASVATNYPTFLYYWSAGAEEIFRLIGNLAKPEQHALQTISHCLYDNYGDGTQNNARQLGQTRRTIYDSSYIDNQISYFGRDNVVNNKYRGRFVAIDLRDSDGNATPIVAPAVEDKTLSDTRINDLYDDGYKEAYSSPEKNFTRDSSTYYAALKQRLRNQYGQIKNIKQIPISCMIPACVTVGVPPVGGGTGLVIGERVADDDTTFCEGNLIQDSDFELFTTNPSSSDWASNPSGYWQGSYNTSLGTYQAVSGNTTAGFNELTKTISQTLNPYDEYELSFDITQIAPGDQINVIAKEDYNGTSVNTSLLVANSVGTHVAPNKYTVGLNRTLTGISFEAQGSTPSNLITWDVEGPSNSGLFAGNFVSTKDCDADPNRVQFAGFSNIQNDINSLFTSGVAIDDKYSTTAAYPLNLAANFTGLDCTALLEWNLQLGYRRTAPGPNGLVKSCIAVKIRRISAFAPSGNLGSVVADLVIASGGISGALTTNVSAIGSTQINNPDPNDIYTIVGLANGVEWSISGNMSLTTCIEPTEIGITNVCFRRTKENVLETYGCTDPSAVNYDPDAQIDDGSCIFQGCTDPFASNYNPNATISCEGITEPCCIYDDPPPQGGIPFEGFDGPCNHNCGAPHSSYTLFGGDTYVNRYTEKNSFFYFYDWLYGQPDRTEFDYLKYRSLPYPTYWFDSIGFSPNDGITSAWTTITNPGNWGNLQQSLINPSDFHVFDRPKTAQGSLNSSFVIRKGYIYLFNSGVRDFYVESEYNVDFREYGKDIDERHYNELGKDTYTNTDQMFSPKIIRSANYYKYNNSLSASKIVYESTPWGAVYPPYYDPTVAQECYVYEPDKLIYSLPAQLEQVRDNWRQFLTNNYKKFLSPITAIKQIGGSGNIILFNYDSPLMFKGVDELRSEGGVKFTIGDGGLFAQPGQNIINADRAYQYASCQSRRSVVNTVAGTFWMCQDQGKIFEMSDGLKEVSMGNLKWWIGEYLPCRLTKWFPDYTNVDNPITGVGCQTVYDNENMLIYFCKKDYEPKLQNNEPIVQYDEEGFYVMIGPAKSYVDLGDSRYFKDASWTLSYDVKIGSWVSYHDWHPDLTMPSKNTFMTTKGSGVWVHNDRCDLYCNYYDVNHPFEIEYTINTMQDVQVLRSIEYQLEVYKYKFDSCYDRFHELDFNFDEAIVYNTEQCSGLLKLFSTPKNNPQLMLQYPIVSQVGPGTSGNTKILYSKEENKYRLNQFWDLTHDRGEFPIGSNYPPTGNLVPNTTTLAGSKAQQTLWITEPNGYVRNLRNSNLHYGKDQIQRKRFRHYTTSVLLRRKVSGSRKMLLSLVNNKTVKSIR